ncbi:hypothetical protein OK074_6956 [Actinobacteria bacterium OK074]|nr:hypothetical protein OK074_6956 [Actinobacteria bacterium OK074]
MNSLETRRSWFRICWTLRGNGRTVEFGTLTGRDVPHMLTSLRDCLPLAPQDTEDAESVRTAAETPEGWSYASDTISLHTHHTPVDGSWLRYFGCPERANGDAP